MAEAKVVEAKVVENLPHQIFEVETSSGQRVKAHLATDMKMKYTRLLPGDCVQVEISTYDAGRGRIVSRRG